MGAVDVNGPADDAAILAESPVKERVADKGDLTLALRRVGCLKIAAQHGLDAEQAEKIRGDDAAFDLFRPVLTGQVEGVARAHVGEVFEKRILTFPFADV